MNMLKKITHKFNKFFFILIFLFFEAIGFSYEVNFEGIQDVQAIQLMESVSQLIKLKKEPLESRSILKKRAEGDIVNFTTALHSLSYYDAKVQYEICDQCETVNIKIVPGPSYPLKSYSIRYLQSGIETCSEPSYLPPIGDLGIHLDAPALADEILGAEDALLDNLQLQGYAYASILKREVYADQKEKVITVHLDVELGPVSYFGPVKIKGLERVNESFFPKKYRWCEGDLYDPIKLEKTQEALELSGLFNSVNISKGDKPTEGNLLPLEINVVEAKQRTIGFGVNFTTELGPGIAAEWEDRNIAGEGQKLTFKTDLWVKYQEGKISYLIPDFQCQNQNLIWQIDYKHERVKAFRESALSFSATIEKQLNERLRVSYGAMYKLLRSEKSARNGTFDLIKIPLQLHWSRVDSLLDPSIGCSLQLKAIPSLQVLAPYFAYSIQSMTLSGYYPLTQDKRHVFAAKLMAGTILGASKHEIPTPERFFAGSENALRGYRYLTVSPIGKDCKVLGGRSLLVYSFELRSRIGKNFGLVGFYEIGNVFSGYAPNFNEKFLQSVGAGIRYHTPVGPLRMDLAVPLNRRHHFDHPFEIYFSIGQAF